MNTHKKQYIALSAIALILLLVGVYGISNKMEKLRLAQVAKQVEQTTQEEQVRQSQYQLEIKKFEGQKDRSTSDSLTLATAYGNTGDFVKAQEVVTGVLSQDPGSQDAYILLGNILREEGKYDEAEQSFRQALSIDPAKSDIYGNIAVMYYSYKGDLAGAKKILLEGIVADPKNDNLKELLKAYNT
ncbi:MAG: tetratricopeptide repeat protein [Patescibacteria group bacterium]